MSIVGAGTNVNAVNGNNNNNNNGHGNGNNGSGNCLPHKLRHKSHLGDKDVAATALLSLQAIKQEPGINSRASPPWDAEGSSDERDSGISLGAEWGVRPSSVAAAMAGCPTTASAAPRAIAMQSPAARCEPADEGAVHATGPTAATADGGTATATAEVAGVATDDNRHIKSEVARLASEVATLKNMLSSRKSGGPSSAAAQSTTVAVN